MSMSPQEIAQFLESQWYKKSGLATAIILVSAIELFWLTEIKTVWWLTLGVILVSDLLIYLLWLKSNRPPKTPKDKIGFLICIACNDDEEATKLREDFVIPLRQLIKSGQTGDAFHFIELPQHLARNVIDPDDAHAIRLQSRAHFMLFGRVRLRPIDGKEHHVIELEGLVAHNPIPDKVKEKLSTEFTELLPRRVNLPIDNDLLTFQFTSEWADLVAKYIIGISAACSGDLDYAERLYKDAQNRLNGKDNNFPVFSKLSKRLPIRISELYEARASASHARWTDDHDPAHLEELGNFLSQVDESRKQEPMFLNLSSIHNFLTTHDANSTIEILRKSKDQESAIWHYNMAFLYCYDGNLKKAAQHYRAGSISSIDTLAISQIEDFICWLLENKPEKYQLYYGLGMFNWKVKGDKLQATKDFEEFLRMCDRNLYHKEYVLVEGWLKNELMN